MCFHPFYKQRNFNIFMREKYEEFHFVEIGTNIQQMQQIISLVLQFVSTFMWENGGKDLNVLSLYISKLNIAQLHLHWAFNNVRCGTLSVVCMYRFRITHVLTQTLLEQVLSSFFKGESKEIPMAFIFLQNSWISCTWISHTVQMWKPLYLSCFGLSIAPFITCSSQVTL